MPCSADTEPPMAASGRYDHVFDPGTSRVVVARRDDDVQIAVGHVPKDERAVVARECLDRGIHIAHVFLHVLDGQAHVEGEQRRDVLHLPHVLADVPDRAPLALGARDGDVGEHTVFERLGEHTFELLAIMLGIAAQRFRDGVKRRAARERRAVGGGRRRVVVVIIAPQRFEGSELAAEPRIEAPQQFGQRIEIGKRRQHRLLAARAGHQPKLRTRDDAERALAADEQLLQVVPRVVLEHPVERGQHGAIGEDSFDAEHQVAHHAVAQHAQAPGIGGDVPTHRGAVARTEVERKHHAAVFGGALHLTELGTGLCAQCPSRNVDAFDTVH